MPAETTTLEQGAGATDLIEKTPEQIAAEATGANQPEKTQEEIAAEKVEKEKKEGNHDTRRMTKFMQRAFKAEAELEVAKRQLEQRQQPSNGGEQKEPQPEDFPGDTAAYLKAVRSYDREVIKAEVLEHVKSAAGATSVSTNWATQTANAQKAHADYQDVTDAFIEVVGDVQLPGHVQDALQTSDVAGGKD